MKAHRMCGRRSECASLALLDSEAFARVSIQNLSRSRRGAGKYGRSCVLNKANLQQF